MATPQVPLSSQTFVISKMTLFLHYIVLSIRQPRFYRLVKMIYGPYSPDNESIDNSNSMSSRLQKTCNLSNYGFSSTLCAQQSIAMRPCLGTSTASSPPELAQWLPGEKRGLVPADWEGIFQHSPEKWAKTVSDPPDLAMNFPGAVRYTTSSAILQSPTSPIQPA